MRSKRFRRADDVAADFFAGEARDFSAGRRLQIGDRRHRQNFGRRQFGSAGVAQLASIRLADRGRKTRFGAQLISAGDEDELIGSRAQLIANVGEKIVEIALLADDFGQRLARHGRRRGEDRRLDATQPFAPARALRQLSELADRTAVPVLVFSDGS